jgi:hypothetical protein
MSARGWFIESASVLAVFVRHTIRGFLLGGLLLVAFAASASSAGASGVSYSVSVSGQQDLTWSVDGTSGSCEIRHGAGNGQVSFRFRSPKPGTAVAKKHGGGLLFLSSIPSTATGTIAGTFTDSVATPCPGFEPQAVFTEPATGCGATKFGVRVDASAHGSFIYVTGPNVPLGTPGSISETGGGCPFLDSGDSSDFSTCGDGQKLWQRSWAFGSQGEGLAASRIAVTPRLLVRPKRRTIQLTGRSRVDCTMTSTYTGGVKIALDLRYTLTLRRMR